MDGNLSIKNISTPVKYVKKDGTEGTKWYNIGTLFQKDDKVWMELLVFGKAQAFPLKPRETTQDGGQWNAPPMAAESDELNF